MLRVTLKQAEPGMKLAMAVRNPRNEESVLLQAGYELRSDNLERLKNMGVERLWVKYPGLDYVDRQVSQAVLERQRALVPHVRKAFEAAQKQALASMDLEAYTSAVSQLVEELLTHRACAMFMNDMVGTGEPLMNHCLRTSYLSMLLGLKLDAYLVKQRKRLNPRQARQVSNLGLGAMLHDIGLTALPPGTLDKYADGEDPDDAEWRNHPKLGFEMVRNQADPTARAIILHHHQHFDGSGYPMMRDNQGNAYSLEGEAIHVFVRIVTVAETYDRLCRGYDDRPKAPPVGAIRRMLEAPMIDWFDPVVLEAFLATVPPFPPGSLVTLNDGRRAAVVEHHPDAPCRPKVQFAPPIADDEEAPKPEPIDLREADDLAIVEHEGVDVGDKLFDVPEALMTALA